MMICLCTSSQCIQVLKFHSLAAAQFSSSTVTVSAESVDGLTPAVRVTWSTTASPECVASVRVNFRTSSPGPIVATNITTNTSQTEFIQTGLQCGTNYSITVVVSGVTSDGIHSTLSSRQVHVKGNKIVCIQLQQCDVGTAFAQTYLPQLE